MNEALIALRNVTFGYEPGHPVLRDVSLEIRAGDRVALSGRNGAGKTTLLHLLVGLRYPGRGHVEAWGRVRRKERDFVEVRRRVGLMFQNSDDQLFCPTVLEDVAFGPLNLGREPDEARRVSLRALEVLGIAHYADRIAHRLSVGEKKLVALAALLSMEPSVLLLDEPTAGLDGSAVERVAAALEARETALLIVSQDTAFLRRIGRCALTLAAGRIRAGAL